MPLVRFRSITDTPWAIQTKLRGWAGIGKALELGATVRWLSGAPLPPPGVHKRKITMEPASTKKPVLEGGTSTGSKHPET